MTFHQTLPLEDQFLMALYELLPLEKKVVSGEPRACQAFEKEISLAVQMVPFGVIE